MTFLARLEPDASENEHGSCHQWVAAIEGEHPPCWSDGACWASNEDEVASLQPTAWRSSDMDMDGAVAAMMAIKGELGDIEQPTEAR